MTRERRITPVPRDPVGRGFSQMDPERQREIASLGGKEAHRKGTAHTWDSESAREAGRKGGMVRAANRKRRAEEAARIQQQHHQGKT